VLYNWQAAVKACPKGWHLPTDDEWTLLIDFLGGENLAGGKMKETGTSYWNSPNILAKNESGFSGLPGGNRYSDGGFDYIGNISIWWSSTKYSPIHAWIRLLNSNYGYIGVGNYNMQNGLSVRCISDIETNNEGKATIKKSSKIEQICDSSFADIRDGNQYQTVKIGNQCWMKENLAYLPNVSPASQISDTIAFYYVYDYKDSIVKAAKASSNYETYGVLYNWQAAVKACPKGWHLPSDSEWRLLIDNLGGKIVAAGKMVDTKYRKYSNTGLTIESRFSGFPGGRSGNGYFSQIGSEGNWWTSTEKSSANVWTRKLIFDFAKVKGNNNKKQNGLSVRCIMD